MEQGSIVVVYKDHQNNEDPIGVAKLIRKDRTGYPFILDEQNETIQETYVTEYWELEWVTKFVDTINPERKVFPIRKLYTIGLTTTSNSAESVEPDLLLDKFLTVDGKEIF